ncbi:AGAP003821-PA-like protein [Anopheles sinensis]|uniref:ubiquitinyl hydrolase 1 n=1 Tax=Anopheles sinensis TaxID=74873 RepID=A0A084VC15_ANOSI|nr:AGAP003821-PA-like protein [Anopheles sinensis]
MKCTHLHNVVQLSLVELCKLKKDESCSDCETNGPNLWICLQKNCLHIGCSEQYKDHSTIHFQSNRAHCIHMNLSSQRVWCYLCESELFLTKQSHHHQQQQQQQQQHHHHYHQHHRRTSVVSNDSSDTSRYSSVNNDKLVVHADKLMSGAAAAAAAAGYAASTGDSCDSSGDEDDFERHGKWNGLVGLQNLANTCYMNAALQALSNSPPLTGFFLDCGAILETDLLGGTNPAITKPGLAKHYHKLIREMWCKNRRYVVPSGILCGIRIVHPMFRGYQQHDTQEFLRCFMDQLHEELKEVLAPPPPDVLTPGAGHDDELEAQSDDRPSPCPSPSPSQSEGEYETCDSGVSERSSLSDDPLSPVTSAVGNRFRQLTPRSPSPQGNTVNQRMVGSGSRQLRSDSSGIRQQSPVGSNRSNASSVSSTIGTGGSNIANSGSPGGGGGGGGGEGGSGETSDSKEKLPQRSIISDIFDGKLLSSVQCLTCDRVSTREETFQDLSLPIPGKDHLAVLHQTHTGMATGSSAGSNVSSAGSSISGGGGGAGSNLGGGPNGANGGGGSGNGNSGGINCSDAVYPMVNGDSWLWWFWNSPFWSWVRSWFWGPAVTLHDCMAAFFSADELKGDNMYSCERCNKLRNGVKYSRVLALPEMLCVHLKRFRHDLSYSSKISSPVHFPLYGLDMRPYLHKDCKSEVTSYDLCAVICHHGTVGGGHYTSFAKHDPTGKWFEFDDQLVTQVTPEYVQSCEAYVLFYRKNNAKMATVRAQASNLLTMQEHASDIRFYVSRNWLHRFNTFAEPGPIDNWTLLCPHGAFPPNKASHFSKLVVPFPQALWDFLYKKFGGGPVCNHIFPCHICKKAAETLSRRQRYELETFTAYNDEFQFNDTPTTIYAISMAWFRQWQLFARGLTTEDPGPINNKTIVVPGDTSVPLRNVRSFSDYAQINASLWHFFHGIYGGGPEIVLQGNPVPPPTSVAGHVDEYIRLHQHQQQQQVKQLKQDRASESLEVAEGEGLTQNVVRTPTSVNHADRDSAIEVTITEPTATAQQPLAPATVTRPHKSVSFEDTDAYCDDDDDDDDGGDENAGKNGDNDDDEDGDGNASSGNDEPIASSKLSGSKRKSSHSQNKSSGSSSRRDDSKITTLGALKRRQQQQQRQLTNGDAGSNVASAVQGVEHLEIGTKKDRRHKGGMMKANGFFGPEGKYQSASIDYSNGPDNGQLPRTESFSHYPASSASGALNGRSSTAGSMANSSSTPSFGVTAENTTNDIASLLMQAGGPRHTDFAKHEPLGHGSDEDEDDNDSKATTTEGTTTSGGSSSIDPSSSAKAYQQHSGRKGGHHHHHHNHHSRHGTGNASEPSPVLDKNGGREGSGGTMSFGRRKLKMKYMKKLARAGSGSRSSRNGMTDSDGLVGGTIDSGSVVPLAINGMGEAHQSNSEGVK